MSESLRYKRLNAEAKPPTRGSAFAAGYDIYSVADMNIPSQGKAVIPTGIAIAVPSDCYGRIAPRSGLALKHSLHTGAGVIDADYRGEVGILIFNLGKEDYLVKKGERIAQLILEVIRTPPVEEVEELEATDRGANGFGSTGKKEIKSRKQLQVLGETDKANRPDSVVIKKRRIDAK